MSFTHSLFKLPKKLSTLRLRDILASENCVRLSFLYVAEPVKCNISSLELYKSLIAPAKMLPTSYLYGTGSQGGSLCRIDLTDYSSEVLAVGSFGGGGLAYVPEPATLLLLGLGAVMVRRKRS